MHRFLSLVALFALGCTPGRVGSVVDAGMDARAPETDAARECTGCTDLETGACLRGTSDTACGPAGGTCEVCGDGRTCVDRACADRGGCSPADCPGCCEADLCVTTLRVDACGSGGAACVACAAGESCVDGMCEPPPTCGPDSCAGCCDGAAACQTGDDALTACGTGGATCAVCDAGWACTDGVCTPPCAESCTGCCEGEVCLSGSATSACGLGGRACAACGAGDTCTSGTCVDTRCSDTCGGCCDGELCRGGTLSGACGVSGNACVDCGPGFTCGASSECEVDPASRWDLFAESASFSAFNPSGSSWDSFSGLPDPYATGEASSAGGTDYGGNTSTVDNTTTPVWDELVLTDVPARDLRRGTTLRVRDDDGIGDDDIGWCYWVPSHDAFSRGRVTLSCPARTSSPQTIAIQLRVRLERR